MKTNVSNMPLNKLYKFADGSFVWATMLNETRGGLFKQDEPSRFTEVFQIDSDGFFERIASGRVVDTPGNTDYDHRFVIYDYDKNITLSFFVTKRFKEATLKDLYGLKEAISKNNEKKRSK